MSDLTFTNGNICRRDPPPHQKKNVPSPWAVNVQGAPPWPWCHREERDSKSGLWITFSSESLSEETSRCADTNRLGRNGKGCVPIGLCANAAFPVHFPVVRSVSDLRHGFVPCLKWTPAQLFGRHSLCYTAAANQASRSTDTKATQTRITVLDCYFNVPSLLITKDLPGKHWSHKPAKFCRSIGFGVNADWSMIREQTLKAKIFSENGREVLIHF